MLPIKQGDRRMDAERLKLLERLDRLTPLIRLKIRLQLSVKERRLLSSIARAIDYMPFSPADAMKVDRSHQSNYTSTTIGRLVKKEWIEKLDRARYRIKSIDVVMHLNRDMFYER